MVFETIFGLKQYNKFLVENGAATVDILSYFKSGHFIESSFEKWESEFLSLFAIMVLSNNLREKGFS